MHHFVVFHSVFMALVELSFQIKQQELWTSHDNHVGFTSLRLFFLNAIFESSLILKLLLNSCCLIGKLNSTNAIKTEWKTTKCNGNLHQTLFWRWWWCLIMRQNLCARHLEINFAFLIGFKKAIVYDTCGGFHRLQTRWIFWFNVISLKQLRNVRLGIWLRAWNFEGETFFNFSIVISQKNNASI